MFDTENDELSNRKVVDMSERLYRLQPDEQQFRVALGKIGSKEATREIVEWLEDEYLPRVSSMAASATSAETTFTVTTGDGNTLFRAGSVVRNMETGEGYFVTATSANSIAVTRSWGGTAAASSTSAAKLLIVGNAAAQGASSGASHIVQKVRAFNYVQDQRDPLHMTDFETAIELYGGREPGEELFKKGVEHGRAVENSLFWGAKDFTSATALGSSGGALEFISTNVTNASGALTPAEFDTFLEGPYAYGSKNKAFFCAPRVATSLSQMLRDVWQPNTVGERKFGAKVDAFISGTYGWTIPIFVKREWADFDNSGTNYGTYGFLIDMDYVRLRYLRDIGKTHIRRNIQEPSSTAVVHEYRTCFSLEFAQEKAHGILKGVTSYAAT
jgi:hypothetical protein